MRLSQRARDLVARCSELDKFADDDGIVCIPSVRGEDPASDRLLRLLHAAGVDVASSRVGSGSKSHNNLHYTIEFKQNARKRTR